MPAASSPANLDALLAHADWLRALARRLVGDADLAEDLTQSAWVAALERPPAHGRPPRRWLAAVLRARAFDLRRRASRVLRREAAAARNEAQPSALEVVERLSTHRTVVEAVLELDEPYRATILLRFFEGLSAREIARRFEVPVATVRTRIARGVDRLRVRLDRMHGGDRRAWCAALAPIAAPRIPWAWIGASVVKVKVTAAAAIVIAAVVLVTWMSAGRSDPARTEEPAATALAERAVAPALATGAEPARESAASADAPPAAPASATAPGASRPMRVASRLRGRVLDLESRALPGIEVRFHAENYGWGKQSAASLPAGSEATFVATSDETGVFEMPAPPVTGEIDVESARWATVLGGAFDPHSDAAEPTVVAAPKIALAGHVVDASGAAVEGAGVSLIVPWGFRSRFRDALDFSVSRKWSTTTDAQGRFEIADAAFVAGAQLRAAAPGLDDEWIPCPEVSRWDLVLTLRQPEARPGWLRGRVVDASGAPAAGAVVTTGGYDPTTSGGDGRFDLKVGLGARATITAAKPGHLPASFAISIDAQGSIDPAGPIELRLGDEPLSISGTVVDARGEPVPNARVWIGDGTESVWFVEAPTLETFLSGGEESNAVGEADARGAFRIRGLLPRTYRVCVLDRRTLAVASRDEVQAGSTDVRVEIPDRELYARVAGRVETRDGKPVAGAVVRLWRPTFKSVRLMASAELGKRTTDEQGRFEFGKVARDGIAVEAQGDTIVPETVEAPFAAPDDVHVVVSLRCHLQVELANPAEADAFQILDAAGKVVMARLHQGPLTLMRERCPLTAGRSEVLSVDESAKTLVLVRGNAEVRRVAIALKPGERTVVRP
ncbi:MAG TPA: sigma-70 family RNA polymerase sigma factor [Planctomycetota bacterium]|nr:sigma-70 family RNA polymerase sigma factor [Planctomycetota bacterium]